MSSRPSSHPQRPRRHDALADVDVVRARFLTGAVLSGLIALAAVVAALQIWVLNPLAAAPEDRTLGQVYADVDAAGQGTAHWFTAVMISAGLVAAALLFWFTVARYEVSRTVLAIGGGMLLALSAPAYWLASFAMGMSLADTYGIGGGDHSPWAWVLYVLAAVGVAVVVRQVVAVLRPASAQAR